MTSIARDDQDRKRPPRPPKQRHCCVAHQEGQWFLLEVSEQKSRTRWQVDYYFCRRLPAAFGHGFELEKQDPDSEVPLATYHVNLHGIDGYHTCECRGFGTHGHCRHVEALLALQQAGRLPPKGVLTALADTFTTAALNARKRRYEPVDDDAAERQAIIDEQLTDAINSDDAGTQHMDWLDDEHDPAA